MNIITGIGMNRRFKYFYIILFDSESDAEIAFKDLCYSFKSLHPHIERWGVAVYLLTRSDRLATIIKLKYDRVVDKNATGNYWNDDDL